MHSAVIKLCDLVQRKIKAVEQIRDKLPDSSIDPYRVVISLFLECLSNNLPLTAKSTQAFWTILSNPEMSRDKILAELNEAKIIEMKGKDGDNKLSKYVSDRLLKIISCMYDSFLYRYYHSSPDDEKKGILKTYFKSNGIDVELLDLAKQAVEEEMPFEAIRFLNMLLDVWPTNNQAKNSLLEIYLKTIQSLIDKGKFDEALGLSKTAYINLRNNLTINTIRFKILAIKIISKYYPKEIPFIDSFWESIKDIKKLTLNIQGNALGGIALTGQRDHKRYKDLQYPAVAIIIMEMQREAKAAIEKDEEYIGSEILDKVLSAHNIDDTLADQIRSELADFTAEN